MSPAICSELVPPGLREPPPRRHLRRKKDSEEEGVGFDPPPPFYGEGVPFVVLFGVFLFAGLALRCFNCSPELSSTLIFAGTFFLVVSGFFFSLIWLGGNKEDSEHRYLVQNGVVVIGVATSADTIPIPDEFGSERTVIYAFSLAGSEVTLESKAQTVSGRLDSIHSGSPVAVIYDPAGPYKSHALLKMLHYTA
ncbi:MAG: hypothetical protein H8F28_01100 [Fibrella sp.]|nr:hypothetical protein [Armatimonadota bacterium]